MKREERGEEKREEETEGVFPGGGKRSRGAFEKHP